MIEGVEKDYKIFIDQAILQAKYANYHAMTMPSVVIVKGSHDAIHL